MNAFKKKILLAGMVAVFSFLTMIGATYAWFTIGMASQVSDIQLNVQTATSLMIMMDDENGGGYNMVDDETYLLNPANYVTLLSNDNILAEYLFTDIILEPVTTTDGLSMIRQDLITAASASPAVPGQYIEFSMWILSQDKDVTVATMELAVVSNESNTDQQDEIVNAVRLSVKSADIATPVIYGYDKDYDYEYTDTTVILPATKTALEALHGLYYDDTAVADQSTDDLALADTILSLTADVPEKVTVRIWIEGWDFDSNNNVLNADFSFSFGFIVKAVL
ncbi:MAG: hypothetical protein WC509_08735 [Candidatus Izemoplasmatales bacterium]